MKRSVFINLLCSNGWNIADAEAEWDEVSSDPDYYDIVDLGEDDEEG
jgi:hypothetical protein